MSGPLTPAQQALAERYVPLARALAAPWKRRAPGRAEDLDGEALLALCQAARTFDATQGVKFATYARQRILGQVRRAFRSEARRGRLVPLARPSRHRRSEPDLDAIDAAEALLRTLPARYAAALRLIYLDGLSQAEAGRRLGVAQSRVCAMHLDSLKMLGDGAGRKDG